jgi:signal transduction histidine kinase
MGLFAGSVLLLLAFIYWSTVAFLSEQVDATIEAEITGLAEQYRERGLAGLVQVIDERVDRDPFGSSIYLFATPNLRPLAGNINAWPDSAESPEGWIHFELRDAHENAPKVEARARSFVLSGGFRLLVGRDIRELQAARSLIIRALGWGLAITLALGLIGGAAMSRSMLRRLDQFNKTSRQIMAGDLSQRVPRTGSADEFDQLAENLNAMLDQIEQLMAGIREVSDNIAHDLRTPLTRLRNRLEGLHGDLDQGSRAYQDVELSIAEADQLLSTFRALLRIARLESGSHPIEKEKIDLAELARDSVELYEAVAQDKGLELSAELATDLTIDGDRDLLFQAIANLLDNAIKYTPTGGRINVVLERQTGAIRLCIGDTGLGIPARERDKVTQRFYRLESSRSTPGNGLGLSLVEAVAKMHGAELDLSDNAPGLRACIRFSG